MPCGSRRALPEHTPVSASYSPGKASLAKRVTISVALSKPPLATLKHISTWLDLEEAGSMGGGRRPLPAGSAGRSQLRAGAIPVGSGSRRRGQAQRGDGPFTGGLTNRSPKRRSPSKPCGGPDARRPVGRSRGAVSGGPEDCDPDPVGTGSPTDQPALPDTQRHSRSQGGTIRH